MNAMKDSNISSRLAGFAGIGFVLTMILRIVLSPDQGDPVDSAAVIAEKITAHPTGILAGYFAGGLAAILLIVFAAGLSDKLRAAGASGWARLAFGGAIATFAVVSIEHAVGSTLAYSVAEFDNLELTRVLFDLDTVVETMARFPMAVFVGAAAYGAMKTGALSKTLVITGFVTAALQLVAGATLAHSGPLEMNGLVGVIGLLAFVFWSLGAGINMTRRPAIIDLSDAPTLNPADRAAGAEA